jgi:hypothetical protein
MMNIYEESTLNFWIWIGKFLAGDLVSYLEIFYRRIWCMFLLLIDVFFLFVSVLNQLHPISIYIVYISVLLVVFHMMNEGYKLYL